MAQFEDQTQEEQLAQTKIKARISSEDAGLIRKILDKGLGVLTSTEDNVRSIVSELTLPRELINYFVTQVDRTKSDVVNLIGREVSQFFQATNISEEVVKALSQMEISINAEIKFSHQTDKKEQGKKSQSSEPAISSLKLRTSVVEVEEKEKPKAKTAPRKRRSRKKEKSSS